MNKRADIAELNPSEPFIAYGRNTAFRFDTTKEALKHADGERVGVSRPHESAHLHVSGEATYTDDIPEVTGTLYAALGLSREPHARIKSMNLDAVRAQPGVVAVYTAKDIPGSNDVGPIVRGDDPILAEGLVQYHGQPVFAVIATSVEAARRAARLASKPEVIDYESLPALLTPEAAHAANAYVLPPMHMKRESSPGAVHKAIAKAPRKLKGTFDVGGQEQFYLEGQIAYARPTEDDGMLVQCSTQHPSEMQHVVAHALGLHAHHVRVECRRMGGGFGGKESQSALFACVAAIAAKKLGRAVKLRVDRDDDFLITGRRHCFHYEYEVGYDDEGRILGTEITMVSRAGFSADLSGPVMTRAICHFDNAYWLPEVAVHGYSGKTNTQSNTAFRGFGGPQGAIAIERIVDSIARDVGRDSLDVRKLNFYAKEGQSTPYGQQIEDNVIHELVAELEHESEYRARRVAIDAFNAQSPVLKRGLALTPVKFGISFNVPHLNQAGALVHVYNDGSILVNHGGTEMGQGLNTKVAQVVAHELGVGFENVRCTATDTDKVANTSATAASTGSDLNGKAAQDAARQIRDRLAAFAAQKYGCDAAAVRFANDMVHAGDTTLGFCELVMSRVPGARAALERRLLCHAQDPLGREVDEGPAVLVLLVRRGRVRSGGGHAHRRMARAAHGRHLRRRPLAQPRRGHRPGRRRLHPGHGLAHDRRAVVAPQERQADDACAEHLQDPDGQRRAAGVQRAAVRRGQPRGHDPSVQGDGRAAAAAALLGAVRHSRCDLGGGRASRRSAARCAGDQRGDPARGGGGA